MTTKTYTPTLHIQERPDSTPTARLFDCWVEGCANVFPTYRCALTSSQAIAYRVECIRKAHWLGQPGNSWDVDGNPVTVNVELHEILSAKE